MNLKNFILGATLVAIGVVFGYSSIFYTLGDWSQMGPGMFPFILSMLLIINGFMIALQAVKWKS